MDDKTKNLYYLDELSDYTVDDGYSDVRGWEVKDKDQRVIGKVDNLLVNKKTERVVYLDVALDTSIIEANHQPYSSASSNEGVHEFLNEEGENHLIIPIGLAVLNEDEKEVYTKSIDHKTFAETKRVKKNTAINRAYETQVLGSYNREDVQYPQDDTLYERGEFTPRNS